MSDTLQGLVTMIDERFPETLPKIHEGNPMTEYEFLRLQANREVVDYILAYLDINVQDTFRDEITGELNW